MDDPHPRELLDVLREPRAMLALLGNAFLWSSWEDAGDALAEVDGLIEWIEAGGAAGPVRDLHPYSPPPGPSRRRP